MDKPVLVTCTPYSKGNKDAATTDKRRGKAGCQEGHCSTHYFYHVLSRSVVSNSLQPHGL